MNEDRYIGVDGCKAGWFFVAIGTGDDAEFGIFESIEKLFNTYSDAKSILIDIPIGLPFKGPRACDIEARKILGKSKTSTVFPPQCREALAAKTYEEACEINKKVLGKKISLQAYHISKKIKEVDDFLLTYPKARQIIRETHPEICFWSLANGKSMNYTKKKAQGFDERLNLLQQNFSHSKEIVNTALERFKRKDAAKDDILDSIVATIVASTPGSKLGTIPETPEIDAMGLPMEIVFPIAT